MLIDLVQLRTFVAVAEEQHLTRAAERLHISQSAASAHVRAVEDTLDTVLFVRTNRSLELTHAGRTLLSHAQRLLRDASGFQAFARELRGKPDGQLAVGTNPDPTANGIGKIVAAIRAEYPLISLDLQARSSAGTRQGLKSGELDIGMLIGRPSDLGFEYFVLSTIRYRVVGPAAWHERIACAGWEELAGLPWIAPNHSGMAYAQMLDNLFKDRGLEINVVARTNSDPVARELAISGVGVTLVREQRALEGQAAGVLAVSPLAEAEFSLLVAYVKGRGQDPLVKAFLHAVSLVFPEAVPVSG